jgi:tetratricopeptide (TPR) repeat protein
MERPDLKEASEELRGFLAQFESAGTTESQGSFTLSPQTAAKALRRFQLPDPHMYLLQMVSAASVGGAEHLAIETGRRQLIFHFEGMEISEDQLRVLDTFLFPAVDAPPHLIELAVGIEAALNFAEEVRVESYVTPAGSRLVINAKSVCLEPIEAWNSKKPYSRVVIRKKRDLSLFRASKPHPELEWLEACRHATLPLVVEGKPYQTEPMPRVPAETVLWVKVVLKGDPMKVAQPSVESNSLPAFLTVEHPEVFGYLALVGREPSNRHGLLFVHRGLVVHRPLSDLGMQVVCGVLHCDSLKKDISHTNFVEDRHFEELQLFLRGLSVGLVTEFCRHIDLYQEHWKEMWGTVVSLLETGELDLQQEAIFREWADHVHKAGEDASPFSSLQKARFWEKEGSHQQAEALRWVLFQRVVKEALICFDAGLFSGLPERCEVLREVSKDLKLSTASDLSIAELLVLCLLDLPFELNEELVNDLPLTHHRLALLRRWQRDLPGAIEFHLRALEHPQADVLIRGWGIRYCAELEFSQMRYQQAEELYEMAELELPKQRDLMEERSYFKRFLGPEHRAESFAYLRRALDGVEADSFVHLLLVEELKKQGKSVLSRSELAALQTKSTYLKLKRLLEEGEGAQIEAKLNQGFDLQGWVSREELIEAKKAAVEQAERAFGPTYLYTRYCRRRCAYQLHRLGAREESERLQCRGHILEHLRIILKGLEATPTPVKVEVEDPEVS